MNQAQLTVAKVLKDRCPYERAPRIGMTKRMLGFEEGSRVEWAALAEQIAEQFRSDNPHFDIKEFYTYCNHLLAKDGEPNVPTINEEE